MERNEGKKRLALTLGVQESQLELYVINQQRAGDKQILTNHLIFGF